MPVRKSIVKAKLAKNEPVQAFCCHLTDPAVYEMVGRMGFDCIWMDMEHHVYSLETAQDLIRAASLSPGSDAMVRPAKWEYMRIGRMLEMGAAGIMYPRCSTAEEAAEVVKYAKFAPLGQRGCDGGNRDMPFCSMDLTEYIEAANRETFIVIQMEEQSAVDQAEAIGAVDGVDILFFGPGDFSVLEQIPGQMDHPKVQKAIEKIAQAAKNTGKHWGMPAGTVERTEELLAMGARFICHGADVIALKNMLESIQQTMPKLGFTYRNALSAGASYMEKA